MKFCLQSAPWGVAVVVAMASFSAYADAQQLQVEALVHEVLQRNPRLEGLNHAVEAARARVSPAGALDDPILSYALAPASIGVAGLDEGHIVGIAQPMPWPGKRAARRDAAASKADVAGHDLEQAQRWAALQARSLFADWYFENQALAANTAQQKLLQDLLKTTRSHYSSGTGGQHAVLAAELRLVQRRREALAITSQLAGVAARINGLREADAWAVLPSPAPLPELAGLPSVLRLQEALGSAHPQIAALDARIRAAEANLRLAKLASWPDLRLMANYLGTLPREENRTQVGLSVNLPFGQSKRTDARRAEEAKRAALLAQRREALAQLRATLQQAIAQAQAAADTRRLYTRDLLPLARNNLQAARAEYSAGAGSVRELIEAENDLLEARLGAERARRDHYQQHARIAWMTGGALDEEILSEQQP